MAENVIGPATAPTVPGHGSIDPPEGTQMKHHLDTIKATATPVSRRNFIALAAAGSAALPAVALAEASGKTSRLPQIDVESLQPWPKVRHLARKLAAALSEIEGAPVYAKIYPKDTIADWPIMFGDIDAERNSRFYIEGALSDLIAAHKLALAALDVATKETDETRLGREPSKAALARCRKASNAEDKALDAVLSYVPYNDVSRYVKVKYLLPFAAHEQLGDERMRNLLISLCGRFA